MYSHVKVATVRKRGIRVNELLHLVKVTVFERRKLKLLSLHTKCSQFVHLD
jgi:hypothetical protein